MHQNPKPDLEKDRGTDRQGGRRTKDRQDRQKDRWTDGYGGIKLDGQRDRNTAQVRQGDSDVTDSGHLI